jgi:hypothetical protein
MRIIARFGLKFTVLGAAMLSPLQTFERACVTSCVKLTQA